MGKITLKDYILAMETVNQYEKHIKKPDDKGGCIPRCGKCHLKFPYIVTDHTKQVNAGGTSVYYADCPYCGKETEVFRY